MRGGLPHGAVVDAHHGEQFGPCGGTFTHFTPADFRIDVNAFVK